MSIKESFVMQRRRIELTNDSISLDEAKDNFLTHCTAKGLSVHTVERYTCDIERGFIPFCKDSKICETGELSQRLIERFALSLVNKGNKPVTIQSKIRQIRAFLYFCMDNDYCPSFKVVLPKAEKPVKETYTNQELKALLKKPNLKETSFNTYKAWVLINFTLGTGARLGAILEMRVKDVDFDNMIITMPKTKTKKPLIVPLTASLSDVLREYMKYRKSKDSNDYLFCNGYGGKGDKRSTQELIAAYNNSRGVSKTSIHLFRHTFAKLWILNGGDVFRLQKLLGHSDLGTTRQYVELFGTDLNKDYEKYNPLEMFKDTQHGDRIAMKKR